jgi:hypothetical protein
MNEIKIGKKFMLLWGTMQLNGWTKVTDGLKHGIHKLIQTLTVLHRTSSWS